VAALRTVSLDAHHDPLVLQVIAELPADEPSIGVDAGEGARDTGVVEHAIDVLPGVAGVEAHIQAVEVIALLGVGGRDTRDTQGYSGDKRVCETWLFQDTNPLL
jgi:hypothetical protein